jgi:phosphonate transport system ATP-binding protein
MHSTAIRVRALNKTFANGRRALQDIDLDVRAGEMVALIGASGSGKSTLLRHLAGLMAADAGDGSVHLLGLDVQHGGRIAPDIRAVRAHVGFVFQQFNLVDRLPVLVNVLAGALHRMPLWRSVLRWFSAEEKARALDSLRRVGIAECSYQRASTLSGGQQQRAAIARAMLQGARLILADEPIASLDPESSRRVMDILSRVNQEDGCTVVVSLHQVNVAMRYCSRTVALHHGRIVYDGPSSALTSQLLRELYGAEADEILSLGDHIGSLHGAHKPAPAPWAAPLPQAA